MTLEEELQGHKEPTQFSRALEELGITSITAYSPQAKGRVERLNGTLQDRLVQELRLAGTKDIKAANRFLPGFLKRFSDHFAVKAEEPGLAYRPLDPALDLNRILSFGYQRVVAMDNTVRLDGRLIPVPPGPSVALMPPLGSGCTSFSTATSASGTRTAGWCVRQAKATTTRCEPANVDEHSLSDRLSLNVCPCPRSQGRSPQRLNRIPGGAGIQTSSNRGH